MVCTVALVGIVTMPAEMYPGDPVTMREETRAILLERELAVAEAVAQHYAQIGEPGQYVVENPGNGRSYSKYGSLAALFYTIPMGVEWLSEGDLPPFTSERRVLYLNIFNLVLSVLLATSVYHTARRFDAAPWVAATFVLLCFYTTFLWNYLRAQTSEIMQLLLFAWAVAAFLDVLKARSTGERGTGGLLRLWAACGALLLMKIAFILVGPLFALGLAVNRRLSQQRSFASGMVAEASLHAFPVLLSWAALAAVNTIKFGAPWLSGYHVWRTDITSFNGNLLDAVYQLLFSVQWGFPFCFPVLVLAIPFMARWLRTYSVAYGTLLTIAAAYVLLIGLMPSWRGEWSYGPRYWIFVLPFVALPAVDAIVWLTADGRYHRACLVVVLLVLVHSLRLQMEVNRSPFFATYYLRGPLDGAMTGESARFFEHHHTGRILREFRRHRNALAGLPWWNDLRRVANPRAITEFENHVKAVMSRQNFYWWR
jgi:hypothetical protein